MNIYIIQIGDNQNKIGIVMISHYLKSFSHDLLTIF